MDRLTGGDGPRLATPRISARLAPNRGANGGFSLIVDGTTQSHVNPDDPSDLQLEYVRLVASAIDALRPAAALSVLHLGGGALSIPRYLAQTRPGSRQHVVELYDELYGFVIEHLPLRDDTITAEFADARDAVARLRSGASRFDVVIVDVFSGDVAPRHLSTVEFFREAAELLAPDGLLIANTLATRGLDFTREAAATLLQGFRHVTAIGASTVFAGEVGNVELIASDAPIDAAALVAALGAQPRSVEVRSGPGLDAIVGDAPVRRD